MPDIQYPTKGHTPGLYEAPPATSITPGPHQIEIVRAGWERSPKNGAFYWRVMARAVDQPGSLSFTQSVFLPYGTAPEGYDAGGSVPDSPEKEAAEERRRSEFKTLFTLFDVQVDERGGYDLGDFVGKRSVRPVVIGTEEYQGRVRPLARWTDSI